MIYIVVIVATQSHSKLIHNADYDAIKYEKCENIHHHYYCETHALLLVMSIGELGKLCSKSITIVIITNAIIIMFLAL